MEWMGRRWVGSNFRSGGWTWIYRLCNKGYELPLGGEGDERMRG